MKGGIFANPRYKFFVLTFSNFFVFFVFVKTRYFSNRFAKVLILITTETLLFLRCVFIGIFLL